jgi:hypothetical protein
VSGVPALNTTAILSGHSGASVFEGEERSTAGRKITCISHPRVIDLTFATENKEKNKRHFSGSLSMPAQRDITPVLASNAPSNNEFANAFVRQKENRGSYQIENLGLYSLILRNFLLLLYS